MVLGGVFHLLGRVRSEAVRDTALGDLQEKEKDQCHREKDGQTKRKRIGMS